MIYKLNKDNKKLYPSIIDFCSEHYDYDFYCTVDNARLFATDEKNLKKFLKDVTYSITLEETGEYQGFLLVWRSKHLESKRYYIKLTAKNADVARKLLTILLWNYQGKEIFAKIRKDNKFLSVLKEKGFRFIAERGFQVLLKLKIFRQPIRENPYVDKSYEYRNDR